MKVALPWLLMLALSIHVAAHVRLLVGLAQRATIWRALASMLLPPLAPLLGGRAGMKNAALVWGAALAVYALGVTLA